MRVLVAGAGAVGSWLGGALAAGGANVTLVARGAHGEAMARAGLQLGTSPGRVYRLPVAASVSDAVGGAPYDAVLVTVKSYDTEAIALELAASLRPSTVLSFQNGVGNERVLAEGLPESSVVPAALTTAVQISAPGVVSAWHKGGVAMANASLERQSVSEEPATYERRTDQSRTAIMQLAAALADGGIEVSLYGDGQAVKWSKLLLNLIGAAGSALLAWPPPRVLAEWGLFRIEHRAWLEAVVAMRYLAHRPVSLPGYPVKVYTSIGRHIPGRLLFPFVHRVLGRERGDRLPGVAMDLAAGRSSTEIEVLNGAVAAASKEAGFPAPTNRALADLVRRVASGELERDRFVGHPSRLIQQISAPET